MSAPPVASTPSPAPASTPSFVREVKATTIFVGSIAPGITDDTLRDLLNVSAPVGWADIQACGPLHELKRVSGASGKPQAFGFASFESPEVVMRCIRCLNGVELPDMTPEGRRDRKPAKPLVVKADEKTREFLDEFEATLGRSDVSRILN
jgi:RNA-binding protein 25